MPITDFFKLKNNKVEHAFLGRITMEASASLLYFDKDKVQNMLHQLKYMKKKSVGEYFGEQIAQRILKSDRFNTVDLIVPVPLHPKKEKLRGYNQSWVIAKSIARELNLKAEKDVLLRKSFTQTQTKKDRLERLLNVTNVFEVNKKWEGKLNNVMLVDDVVTTGATAESCLNALKIAGANQLFFVTAACA